MDKKNHEQHRYLSYLPLAHMFERVSQVIISFLKRVKSTKIIILI